MKLLIVEDDLPLARGLISAIRAQQWVADCVDCGLDALFEARSGHYSAIILDIGLPDTSGIEVVRRLRAQGDRTPVLILTARGALEDKVAGLDAGADDYLAKPFELDELYARLRALTRRGRGSDLSSVSEIGALRVDRTRGEASINGDRLDLRRREWAVLEALSARPGTLISREHLADELFGHDDAVSPNALDVHVSRLRRKLMPDGPEIHTERGRGYMLLG
jgi:two-component system response regulator TctD